MIDGGVNSKWIEPEMLSAQSKGGSVVSVYILTHLLFQHIPIILAAMVHRQPGRDQAIY